MIGYKIQVEIFTKMKRVRPGFGHTLCFEFSKQNLLNPILGWIARMGPCHVAGHVGRGGSLGSLDGTGIVGSSGIARGSSRFHCFLFFWVCCAGCRGHCFLFGSLSPRAPDVYALVCALMDTELLKPGDPLFILVISLYVF